jgi:hypothetical protein
MNLPADAPGILAAVRAGTPVDGLPVLRSGRWQPSTTRPPFHGLIVMSRFRYR